MHIGISGGGRDHDRLQKLVDELDAPVTLLGRVPDEAMPDVYGCGDVFAMLCRTRWGGLEQEGFGIVFLEAAAAGVPQVAGRSGGAHEAVADGETGLVVDERDRGWTTPAPYRGLNAAMHFVEAMLAAGRRYDADATAAGTLATTLPKKTGSAA